MLQLFHLLFLFEQNFLLKLDLKFQMGQEKLLWRDFVPTFFLKARGFILRKSKLYLAHHNSTSFYWLKEKWSGKETLWFSYFISIMCYVLVKYYGQIITYEEKDWADRT